MKQHTLCLLLFVFFFSFVGALTDISSAELVTGKNFILISESPGPIRVSEFISLNPEVSYVSYTENGRSFGYVNVFGGIGTDFHMHVGKEYEIYVTSNVSIDLP